jgi:transposase
MMKSFNKSLNFFGQIFYIGIDVHKWKWVVTIRCNKMELKTFSMDPRPELLHHHMHKNYPGGEYVSAYEAGYFGFWIHRHDNVEMLCYKIISLNLYWKAGLIRRLKF